MAVRFQDGDAATEKKLRDFANTLNEKDRRRFAAIEAVQRGHGGIRYVAKVLGISERTIQRGIGELDELEDDPAAGRVRRPGAGRPKAIDSDSETESNLASCLDVYSAGDPDEEDVTYTHCSPAELSIKLAKLGTPVGKDAISGWLDSNGIGHRQIAKVLAGGEHPDRDAQFQRIFELIDEYEIDGNPWFSMDTKAKEYLGSLFRKGRVRSSSAFRAFDHDFPSWADGVVIPHGIYDPVLNIGHLNLGISHDTTAFACDSFRWFWNKFGKYRYPNATSILLTCDCGGSNSANKYIFKYDLERLAQTIGIEIRVAHYPPYCSKYNWIERRFFPHVSRACRGMLFDTIDTVKDLMRRATTSTGLRTTVNVIQKCYETGRNATKEMKEQLQIKYDEFLPKWNYIAQP